MKFTLLPFTLVILSGALLQVQPCYAGEAESPEDTQLVKHLEAETESPFELDPLEVNRGQLSFEEELTLRIVRQAFNETPSNKQADRDKWLCWTEQPVGSRLYKLGCARNGDVWALRPQDLRSGNNLELTSPRAGYGKIMVASRKVSPGKLKKIFAALPGSAAYDKEFINMALTGKKPPRNVPTEEESEQFAKAWIKVERLHKRGKSENIQITAIKAEGMSLKRYNQIAGLTETYGSIKKDIAARVKLLR